MGDLATTVNHLHNFMKSLAYQLHFGLSTSILSSWIYQIWNLIFNYNWRCTTLVIRSYGKSKREVRNEPEKLLRKFRLLENGSVGAIAANIQEWDSWMVEVCFFSSSSVFFPDHRLNNQVTSSSKKVLSTTNSQRLRVVHVGYLAWYSLFAHSLFKLWSFGDCITWYRSIVSKISLVNSFKS
jgi:hypothetical protein